MATRNWLAKAMLYVVLEFGALLGVPMRPDEIEAMTRQMNDALTVEIRHDEDDGADDPPTRRR